MGTKVNFWKNPNDSYRGLPVVGLLQGFESGTDYTSILSGAHSEGNDHPAVNLRDYILHPELKREKNHGNGTSLNGPEKNHSSGHGYKGDASEREIYFLSVHIHLNI